MPAKETDRFPEDEELVKRLGVLARYCEVIEDPAFSLGEWVAKTLADGTIQLGSCVFTPAG